MVANQQWGIQNTNLDKVMAAAGNIAAGDFKERRLGDLQEMWAIFKQKKIEDVNLLLASLAFAFSVLTIARLHICKLSWNRIPPKKNTYFGRESLSFLQAQWITPEKSAA
jgi:hypothetical protein